MKNRRLRAAGVGVLLSAALSHCASVSSETSSRDGGPPGDAFQRAPGCSVFPDCDGCGSCFHHCACSGADESFCEASCGARARARSPWPADPPGACASEIDPFDAEVSKSPVIEMDASISGRTLMQQMAWCRDRTCG